MSTYSQDFGKVPKDADGQPVTERLRRTAVQSRNIDELIGICRGIAFDNKVTQAEAEHLLSWLHAQPELVQVWPANILYRRLVEVFADGVVDTREANDLLAMLREVIGGDPALREAVNRDTGEIIAQRASTVLPVSEPGVIEFPERHFVLTGKFASGSRAECEAEVARRGGLCQKSPTRKTHYLVIGCIGSRDWAHSSWGRKIEKAVELRDAGFGIEILAEEYWAAWLR